MSVTTSFSLMVLSIFILTWFGVDYMTQRVKAFTTRPDVLSLSPRTQKGKEGWGRKKGRRKEGRRRKKEGKVEERKKKKGRKKEKEGGRKGGKGLSFVS